MEYKQGDKVIYRGELWEVGFVNQLYFRGTLRLQKGPEAGDKSINRVYPEDVSPASKTESQISFK